jgi:hypothetical protein
VGEGGPVQQLRARLAVRERASRRVGQPTHKGVKRSAWRAPHQRGPWQRTLQSRR